MLRYKALRYGASFAVTNNAFSTQVCSEGPKGIADLGIRQWTCSDCGAVHDRDVNAARNFLPGRNVALSLEKSPPLNGEDVK
ncbi:MAG: transposase [Bradyrhizobium sp.]|nr:transposase [Bradyrhizobium sp.]